MDGNWSNKTIIKLLLLITLVSACIIAISVILMCNVSPMDYDNTTRTMIYRQTADLSASAVSGKHQFLSYTGVAEVKDNTSPEEEVMDVVDNPPDRSELVIKFEDYKVQVNGCYSELSKQLNMSLLDYCINYFTLDGVTVLMPMIIANNETAIRADKDYTFCSLYPSKILKPSSTRSLDEMSTVTPLLSEYNFSNLANDWWTRDRGPLQMNPSYGIHSDKWNNLLGASEAEILADISKNFPYTVYTYKEGFISADSWIEQAGTTKGDRFSIKDCCLRLASEYNYALSTMSSAYKCSTQEEKIAMLSMYHGAGSMWLSYFEDRKIGYWNSGKDAYRYVKALTSDQSLKYIYDYTLSVLSAARKQNVNPEIGLTTTEALQLYKTLKDKGLLEDKSAYISAGDYSDGYITYPLKALYSYMQLSLLYNGG